MSDVVIHELRGAWGLPSISPFCLKLQTWLRIAGVPYSSVVDATPFGAPKGKLPFIEHDGRRIGDSGFAIDYLSQRLGRDLDATLDAVSRGTAVALRRMVTSTGRWCTTGGWSRRTGAPSATWCWEAFPRPRGP